MTLMINTIHHKNKTQPRHKAGKFIAIALKKRGKLYVKQDRCYENNQQPLNDLQ